jgi:hypothetical protein
MSEAQEVPVNKRAALDAALANIKKEMSPVTKDGANPHFRSTFATLNAHLKAVEPLLEKWGCVLTQPVVYDARTGSNVQVTKIKHTATGESEESSLNLGEQKDMQKLGSAITYARRYTLGCLLAMQATDDDAEGTMGRKKTKPAASQGDF